MSVSQRHLATACVGVLVATAGCASITSGRHADVRLESNPKGAHVTVRDDHGSAVATVTTPATVSLKRNRRYFLPARYTATFEAPGYQTAEVPIRSTVNPWIVGNVVLGGVLGLAIDNVSGAAWKPKKDLIAQHLTPIYYTGQSMPSPVAHSGQEAAAPPPVNPVSPNPSLPVIQATQQQTGQGVQPASGVY